MVTFYWIEVDTASDPHPSVEACSKVRSKGGSSWCRAGSSPDRPEEPIGRHPPPSSSSAPALIGNLSGSSCACLTSGWPIGRYWSRPPGPNRRYSPNTNRCLKPARHQASLAPLSLVLSSSCHLTCAAPFTSAQLGQPNSQRCVRFACACPSNSTFPPGSPTPATWTPPLFLPPGGPHLNPSHFQLSPGAEPQSSSPSTSSGGVVFSWRAAALPQSCFFVSPTQQSRAAGAAHSRRQGRCFTPDNPL